METKKFIEISESLFRKKKVNSNKYEIYTPEIVKKYKECIKFTLKITKHKQKTMYIMYRNVEEWYKDKDMNYNLEKIHIKTKLGSYTSGGCGIGASLLAGLTASGVFSYMDVYIRNLGYVSLVVYAVIVFLFGFRILKNEDDNVEMYNMFLEVLSELEEENN